MQETFACDKSNGTTRSDYIPASGMVVGEPEQKNLLQAVHDMRLTSGRFTQEFERRLAEQFGVAHSVFVNSGSSANLLAVAALMQPEMGDNRLKPGDEVITVACGFPTTVAPIIQLGCVPVYIDVTLPEYQVDVSQLEDALSHRSRAVVLAHTLGNTFDIGAVKQFCMDRNLWLIEDCCDAIATTYEGLHVGSFGHLATCSFYPAHQITTGEGGAVICREGRIAKIVRSLASWGKDCWCKPGVDNTCGKRFEWEFSELPDGYDHKQVFSRVGFNLQATEFQTAIGCAQMDRLHGFIEARKRNWRRLYAQLSGERLLLPEPTPGADPCWFGFAICTPRRDDLRDHLEQNGVGTRPLFAGNLMRQPGFKGYGRAARSLPVTDRIMRECLWVGVWPGIDDEKCDRIARKILEFS